MSKTPQEIALAAINNIKKDLLASKRTNEEALALIRTHIEKAYTEVSIENKTKLYKQFSLYIHPDKFADKCHVLYSHLKAKELADEPFKIVTQINTKHLYHDINNNPQSSAASLAEYLLNLISPLEEELDRYYQPAKFLTKGLYNIVKGVLIVAGFIGFVAFILSSMFLSLTDSIINKILNLITDNQYTKELHQHIMPNFEQHKKTYLQEIRENTVLFLNAMNKTQDAEHLSAMKDEDFFEQLIQQEIQQINQKHEINSQSELEEIREKLIKKYEQRIIENATLDEVTRLKLVFMSLIKTLAKPLDESNYNKYVTLFLIKPLQFISIPVLFFTASLLVITRLAVTTAAFVGMMGGLLSLVSTLALLNSPLYALDLARYAVNKMQGCCSHRNDLQQDLNNQGPQSLLLDWDKNCTIATKGTPLSPLHHVSLFATAKQEGQTVVNDLNVLQGLGAHP